MKKIKNQARYEIFRPKPLTLTLFAGHTVRLVELKGFRYINSIIVMILNFQELKAIHQLHVLQRRICPKQFYADEHVKLKFTSRISKID